MKAQARLEVRTLPKSQMVGEVGAGGGGEQRVPGAGGGGEGGSAGDGGGVEVAAA